MQKVENGQPKTVDDVPFVNVGSVGQQEDGDWRACYVVVNITARDVEFIRVEYDISGSRQRFAPQTCRTNSRQIWKPLAPCGLAYSGKISS